jgi:adenylate cyclase
LPPPPTLVVVLENGVPKRYPISDKLVLGRDPKNSVALDDGYLSRHHCQVSSQGGRVLVRDLGSYNGTYVNGQKIHEECYLLRGDVLKVGRTRVYVDFGDAEDQSGLPKIYSPNLAPKKGVRPVASEKRPELSEAYKQISATLEGMTSPDDESSWRGPATRVQRGGRIRPDDKTPIPMPAFEESAISRSGSASRSGATGSGRGGGMRVIAQITRVLHSLDDPHEFLDYTLSRVLTVIPAERGIVMRLGAERRGLYPECARSAIASRSDVEALRLGISHTIARKVVRERVSVLVTDAALDKRFKQASSIQDLQIRSVLCVPLWLGEQISGLIYLDHMMHAYAFTESDRDLLVAAANLAALGLVRMHKK